MGLSLVPHHLAASDRAAANVVYTRVAEHLFSLPLGIYLGVELLCRFYI